MIELGLLGVGRAWESCRCLFPLDHAVIFFFYFCFFFACSFRGWPHTLGLWRDLIAVVGSHLIELQFALLQQ